MSICASGSASPQNPQRPQSSITLATTRPVQHGCAIAASFITCVAALYSSIWIGVHPEAPRGAVPRVSVCAVLRTVLLPPVLGLHSTTRVVSAAFSNAIGPVIRVGLSVVSHCARHRGGLHTLLAVFADVAVPSSRAPLPWCGDELAVFAAVPVPSSRSPLPWCGGEPWHWQAAVYAKGGLPQSQNHTHRHTQTLAASFR